MSIKRRLALISHRIKAAVTSARGREVWLFLLFLAISYVFWLLLTLNNETQEDIAVPVAITNVPDSVTIISDVPSAIKVSVRDKGSILMRYNFNHTKVMKIDWNEYTHSDNRFLMGRVDLGGRLRDYFSPSTQLVTVMPDSLKLTYTTNPGRKVPVNLRADLRAALGTVINGDITLYPDSVMLYSVNDLPHNLLEVNTIEVMRSNLADTTQFVVKLDPIDGVRMVPDHVTVNIPVEPLIARTQFAPVITKNVPDGTGLLTFPSQVEVSYLVPMSEYNSEPYPLRAYVDFSDTRASSVSKIPVSISLMPDTYKNVSISPDSVEYIIERR